MKFKNMSKEDFEQLSYTDITYLLLKEHKKSMNTASLFKEICNLLELSEDDFSNKVCDYYTSLTIDKRLYILDNSEWDLSEKHKVVMEIDDEDTELEEESEEALETEEVEEDIDDSNIDLDDDLDDDTLDLSIVTEDELEEEN